MLPAFVRRLSTDVDVLRDEVKVKASIHIIAILIERILTERYGIDDGRKRRHWRTCETPRESRGGIATCFSTRSNRSRYSQRAGRSTRLSRSVIMDFAPCAFPIMRRVATAESWNRTVTLDACDSCNVNLHARLDLAF